MGKKLEWTLRALEGGVHMLVSIVYHLENSIFISSFSRFTWVQLFPVHFFSSPYNSSKNSYKFKVHSAPNLWQHFKQDSPNQALTTVFFNSSFYVFFFSFLYQELQVIWQPQIRSHMLWCPCMAWVTRYNKFHMVLDSHRCCNSFEDVRDNCFCAYLLRTQIHTPRHGSMRAISNKMNNDRADGHCFALI